jgi:hypothetical protein
MLKALFFAGVVFGLGLGSPAKAGTESADKGTVVAHATVRGKDVPVYQLGEVQADNTPQGMDGFAITAGSVLHAWTAAHGVEAIGNLCHTPDGKRWGAVVLTIYAHTSSPITNACPEGMTSTGVTIHSHPQRHRYSVNPVDRLFLRNRAASTISTWPDKFSPDDFAAGPGYMIGQMALHFQDGQGHVRTVATMKDIPPAPAGAVTGL